jgi:hypothetical protein
MIKRRGMSQLENLTLDHKPLESSGQIGSKEGVGIKLGI